MIGIINVGDIRLAPFIKKYTESFDRNNISYDIIHWDREGKDGEYPDNVYTFSCVTDRFGNKLKRIVPYLKFSWFIRRIIKEKKYDKLVILTTQTAFILIDVLLGRYKKRYYFDYRDTSYEYIKPYSRLVNKICDSAECVAISSRGFLEYISTKTETFTSHNFQTEYYSERKLTAEKADTEPFTVGYIGVLREYDYLVRLADMFGKDRRFRLDFHGTGDDVERLRAYCEKYDNVSVHGAYAEEDKHRIIEGFDVICYNYPYSFVNYPAVANKLYDGLICKKPMFANRRTYSGEIIAENRLGISPDQGDDGICQKLYDYLRGFDAEEFAENCEKYLQRVIIDEKEYIASIDSFACRDSEERI